MKIEGVPVTSRCKKALYKKKYSTKVADHLGLTNVTFERIDWKGHARTLKNMGGPSLKRILWGQHPTCTHLKISGQYPDSRCPLFLERDNRDHFLL